MHGSRRHTSTAAYTPLSWRAETQTCAPARDPACRHTHTHRETHTLQLMVEKYLYDMSKFFVCVYI